MENIIKEYFGCDCGGLSHTFNMTYFKPTPGDDNDNDNDNDDNIIYLSILLVQWRKGLFPRFDWKDIFDLDSCWCPFRTKLYKDFYYSSTYKRWGIAFQYLFGKNTFDSGILDVVNITDVDDLDRLYKMLNYLDPYYTEKITENVEEVILESETYSLLFEIDVIDADMPKEISAVIQFKPQKWYKRWWRAIKYGFGFYKTNYGIEDNFEITPKDAAILKKMVEKVKQFNEEIKSKNKIL